MARFHSTPDGNVAFTSEEEASRDAEEKAWADGASERATKAAILSLEAEITQRRQREAGADDAGGSQAGRDWMAAQQAKLATERSKL